MGASSRGEHINIAPGVAPISQLMDGALAPRTKLNTIRRARAPSLLLEKRAMSDLRGNAKRLEPLRHRRAEAAHEVSPDRAIRRPLLHFPISNLEYADATQSRDMAHGLPIAGESPSASAHVNRARPAKTQKVGRAGNIPTRNISNVERVKRGKGSAAPLEWRGRDLDGAGKGPRSTPGPITGDDMATLPQTPRFPKREQ